MHTNSSRDFAVQSIKSRLNIVDIVRRYVTLQHVGNRWMAPCPFHQETKPSFSVDEENGYFYCFGCQAKGDIFEFYQRINGLDFKETLEELAQEAGVSLKNQDYDPKVKQTGNLRKAALKMHDAAKSFYSKNLNSSQSAACREYIAVRALDEKIVQAFELGWSLPEWDALAKYLEKSGFDKEQAITAGLLTRGEKGGVYDRFRSRLMFPIKNLSGQVIAFGGRIIDNADVAKYINSSDTPIYKKGDNLYGLFQSRRAIAVKKSVMLTEGYMDVLTLHQFGYQNACGVLGTALTPEQIKRLAGFCSDFELIFDGDAPGRKAALRSAEMLLKRGLRCKVVLLPDDEDIDSLLKGSPDKALGPDTFEALRQKAPDGLNFCMRVLNKEFAPKDILAWIKQFLGSLEQPEFFSRYVSELSRGLSIDERLIRKTFAEQNSGEKSEKRFSGQEYLNNGNNNGLKKISPASVNGPDTEEQILAFAVRYPQYIKQLQDAGAGFVFSSSSACDFWAKITAFEPFSAESDILPTMDDKQKDACIKWRINMPPPDKEKDDLQLQQLCVGIKRIIEKKHNNSLRQTLDELKHDGASVNEVLKITQDKLTEKFIVEHKYE
jgi:DNA primase